MSATRAHAMARASPSASSQSGREGINQRTEEELSDREQPPEKVRRSKYVAVACNECKRRKIRCTGQTPCRRCNQMSLQCVYRSRPDMYPSPEVREFKSMKNQMESLQKQVDTLKAQLSGISSQDDPPSSSSPEVSICVISPQLESHRAVSSRSLIQFQGPTSSTYLLNDVKLSLQAMGITDTPEEEVNPQGRAENGLSVFSAQDFSIGRSWSIDRQEACRLMKIYEEECHLTYPVFNMDQLRDHADMIFSGNRSLMRNDFVETEVPLQYVVEDDDDQTILLKVVLACALVLDGQGQSDLGQRLYASVKQAVESLIAPSRTLASVALLVATATFHFWRNEESQAWRTIGLAARISFEIGLHRRDILSRSFPDPVEFQNAVRIFWAVYALDRRFSFGTGMPFAFQDSDIDPSLPEPDSEFPYLLHITKYNQILAKIWTQTTVFESGISPSKDNADFLDYQVLLWYSQLPPSLGFDEHHLATETAIPNRGLRRLRLLMYLRRNQARISLYRAMLPNPATSAAENQKYAEIVVTIAKETIHIITAINGLSDLYRSQQVCYNYFLVQAVASILLAAVRFPVVFNDDSRKELSAGIDLLEMFQAESLAARRLWHTIRDAKYVESKLASLTYSIGGEKSGDVATKSGALARVIEGDGGLFSKQAKGRDDSFAGLRDPGQPVEMEANEIDGQRLDHDYHEMVNTDLAGPLLPGRVDDFMDHWTFSTVPPNETEFQRFVSGLLEGCS